MMYIHTHIPIHTRKHIHTGVLGRILYAQGKREEAEPMLLESLDLEVEKVRVCIFTYMCV